MHKNTKIAKKYIKCKKELRMQKITKNARKQEKSDKCQKASIMQKKRVIKMCKTLKINPSNLATRQQDLFYQIINGLILLLCCY